MPLVLNFFLYLLTCLGFWALGLAVYARITPYPEWRLVREGNLAAAMSLSGTALGLAAPLASLAAHAVSLVDLALWAVIALLVQLGLWGVMNATALKGLGDAIRSDRRSVGLVLGACSLGAGLLNAACLTY